MAIIKCPECSKEISDKAKVCIHCGFPLDEMQSDNISKDEREDENEGYSFSKQNNIPFSDAYINHKKDIFEFNVGRKILDWIFVFIGFLYSIISLAEASAPGFFVFGIWTLSLLPLSKPLGLWKKIVKTTKRRTWILFAGFMVASVVMVTTTPEKAAEDTKKITINNEMDETISEENTVTETEEKGEQLVVTEKETEKNNISKINYEENTLKLTEEYLFIMAEDLQKYCVNMENKNVKIYTIITVDEVTDDSIKASLNEDGLMMSQFMVNDDLSSEIRRDDVIVIAGEVCDTNTISLLGISSTTVSVKDCFVCAKGTDVNKYKKTESDPALGKYLLTTSEVVSTSKNITKEEYVSICQTIPYNDVLRNPDNYKHMYVTVSGKINQIIEGWFGYFTIYVTDSNGNKWECSYSYEDGESHMLEGDWVTFYGECKGTTTSTTLMGKQVTLVGIDVKYR